MIVMDKRLLLISGIALSFLVFAFFGIIYNHFEIINHNNSLSEITLSSSVLALAFLSLGLFFENNISRFKEGVHKAIKIIGYGCISFSLILILFTEITIFNNSGRIFTYPILMAILAIAIFLLNFIFNQIRPGSNNNFVRNEVNTKEWHNNR
jgi:hypothetical protein